MTSELQVPALNRNPAALVLERLVIEGAAARRKKEQRDFEGTVALPFRLERTIAFKFRPTFSPTLRGADPAAAPLCREKEASRAGDCMGAAV